MIKFLIRGQGCYSSEVFHEFEAERVDEGMKLAEHWLMDNRPLHCHTYEVIIVSEIRKFSWNEIFAKAVRANMV